MPSFDKVLNSLKSKISRAKNAGNQELVDKLCSEREAYKKNQENIVRPISGISRKVASVQAPVTAVSSTTGVKRSATVTTTQGHSVSKQTDQVRIIRVIEERPDGAKVTHEEEVKESQIQTEARWQTQVFKDAIHTYATTATSSRLEIRSKYNTKHFRILNHRRVDAVTETSKGVDLGLPLTELMCLDLETIMKIFKEFKQQRELLFVAVYNLPEEALQLHRRWNVLCRMGRKLSKKHPVVEEIMCVLAGSCYEIYIQRLFAKLTIDNNMSQDDACDRLERQWGPITFPLGGFSGLYILEDKHERDAKVVIQNRVRQAEEFLQSPETSRVFFGALAQSYLVKKMLTNNMHEDDVKLYYHVEEFQKDHLIKPADIAVHQLVRSDYEEIVAYVPKDHFLLVDHIKLEIPTIIKGYLDIELEAALWGESLSDTLLPKIKDSMVQYFEKKASKFITPENMQAYIQRRGDSPPPGMNQETFFYLRQASSEPAFKEIFEPKKPIRDLQKEEAEEREKVFYSENPIAFLDFKRSIAAKKEAERAERANDPLERFLRKESAKRCQIDQEKLTIVMSQNAAEVFGKK